MTIMFINRKKDLRYLEDELKSGNFKFISIIGRRRTGKTTLIEEFIKNKQNVLYFLVQELNDLDIRLSFAEKLHHKFNLTFLGTPSWDELFEKLFKEAKNKRIMLVFDEFQRFLRINKSVPSILQGYIDTYHKNSRLFLITMGSSIGMMYKLFGYSSALYGRRTGQMFLQPLKLVDLFEWFPKLTMKEIIEIYSVFGGTPKYLQEVNNKETIIKNIERAIISKRSILYSEPEILIKTELSNAMTYFNILKLIALGRTKAGEIADMLTIKITSIDYFLNILEKDLDLIKKEVPITEKKPEKSKKSMYLLKDNFFRFWFKYIYSNLSELEIENTKPVAMKIQKELNQFIGYSFEDIVKEIISQLNDTEFLPFTLQKIGKWWHKDKEIDIVALNEEKKEILFGECKWKDKVNIENIFRELKEKSGLVKWNNGKRKEHYVIFARSFEKKIKEKNLFLFDLDDLEKILKVTKRYNEI